MRIYAGSQNASRIAGQYVYPQRRYSTAPVEQVPAIQARNPQSVNRLSELEENQDRKPASFQRPDKVTYSNMLFKNAEYSQKGLFLNILG